MRLSGHGHEHTRPGQRSPLMVTVDWLVSGHADERQNLSLGPDDDDMIWTWHDLRVTVDAHDYDDWMQLTVHRLELDRVEAESKSVPAE